MGTVIVVIWGVSGCGKTTVGRQLADMLAWSFYDADEFHPEVNVDKMRQGIPLDDDDRYPWLKILANLIRETNDAGRDAVLACSALKQDYRNLLGINQQNVCSVLLSGDQTLIKNRLQKRSHEFMNNNLLTSQFATLESATDGLEVNIEDNPTTLCEKIIRALTLLSSNNDNGQQLK
jgi:carbohydrate kinase (thermoresistant glucokinase family)